MNVIMISASQGDCSVPNQWFNYDQKSAAPCYSDFISFKALGFSNFVRKLINTRRKKNLIVHLNHAPAAFLARIILGRRPDYILTLHREFNQETRRNQTLINFITKFGINVLVSNSQNTQASVPKSILSRQKNCVIYNGVDETYLEQIIGKTPNAKRSNRNLKLVCLGRLEAIKNPRGAVRLADLLSRRLPTSLTFIGSGNEDTALRAMGEQTPCEITFRGQLDYGLAMQELIEADLVVIPSISEGYCNVAVEAMFLKKKIVYNAIPTLKEVIANNGLALDFENSDIEDVIAYIEEPVSNHFDPIHTFQKTHSAYRELLT